MKIQNIKLNHFVENTYIHVMSLLHLLAKACTMAIAFASIY